jgi:hypothetical protein
MGDVVPFRRRSKAPQQWDRSRTFVPLGEGTNDLDRATLVEQVAMNRLMVATPTYCRKPQCGVVVSVSHPLPSSWPHSVACDQHLGDDQDRYAPGGGGLFA